MNPEHFVFSDEEWLYFILLINFVDAVESIIVFFVFDERQIATAGRIPLITCYYSTTSRVTSHSNTVLRQRRAVV